MPRPKFKTGKLTDRKARKSLKKINDVWWKELAEAYRQLPKTDYIEIDPRDFEDMNAFQLRHTIQGSIYFARLWHEWDCPPPSIRRTTDGTVILFQTRRVRVRKAA